MLDLVDSGVTGLVAHLGEHIAQALSNIAIDKEVKEELEYFNQYSVLEMEERLPIFFSMI